MATKVLNIELGDRITKVCVSEKKNKGFQIDDSFLFQTPSDLVRDGQIADVDTMAVTLKDQLRSHGVGNVKNVTFVLTSTKVASREVMLPPVKDNRIKSVVETNAADYFPVDISRYSIGYNLLERAGGDTPGCRVQVMAAPRSLLENYAALAEACGLVLDTVDYCGNSQYQVLKGLEGQDTVMYVDVNVSNTFVTFMNNGVMQLQRNISAGGDELVSAAIANSSKTEEDFLHVLEHAENAIYLDGLLPRDQQEDCLSRVISGVARSADFFKSSHSGATISKVVLMGVCSHISGLKEGLEAELEPEVVMLHEVEGVRSLANSSTGISDYISCVGSLVAPLDLLPDELRPQKKKRAAKAKGGARKEESLTSGVVICLLCVLLGAGLAGFSVYRYFGAVAEQQRLENRKQELAFVEQTVANYNAYNNTQASLEKIRALNDAESSHNAGLVAFLEELERKMPTSMLLLSAICDENGVTMNIVTPDMKEADVVISQLRKMESVKQMSVSTITETNDEEGFTTATFSVSCGYEEAQPEETPAETAPIETIG